MTLLIGNDNPKGGAAVASMAQALGHTIEAPQGALRALGRAGRVTLPLFGRRRVVLFDSPEYDVIYPEVDCPRVSSLTELAGRVLAR